MHPELGLPEVRKLWQTEGLFSDHYLKARLQRNSWWPSDAEAEPVWRFCKELYEKRYLACAKNNEAFTRQELLGKILEKLGFAWTDNLGLPESDKRSILQAGFLADIGKELISPNLRNRRGGLSSSEYEIIQQHPEESCRLMRKMGYDNPDVLELVQHSHERYIGVGGYPGKLKGDDIPIGSRIIAVADAYDALTSWRPYREPWERHAALEEINREVEKGIFDPVVVATLARLVA